MTIDEMFNELENKVRDTYIVTLKYKYDFEEKYTIENQILVYDSVADSYAWQNDWNEGQTDVEVLGYMILGDVDTTQLLTCEDCISRYELREAISALTYWHFNDDGKLEIGGAFDNTVYKVDDVERLERVLPSVTPKGVTITDFADRCRECGRINPCEDCISRDAVEKITWEEPSYDDALNVLTEVRDKVRALPSVKPEIKWIPVSEKLPNSYEYILATMISPVTQLPFVNKLYTGENAKEKIEEAKVIAWMVLPKPYKEKQ